MNNYRLKILRLSTLGQAGIAQTILLFSVICCLLLSLMGCEAFVKKFTRKQKKSKIKEEVILDPEDYSLSDIPTEERYRQYFLYWKSWQDELITALNTTASRKKRQTCVKEAIKNLGELRPLLFEEKQKELDVYLEKLRNLENEIKKDTYGARLAIHGNRAEGLKRNILKDFSYPEVKSHLRESWGAS